MSRLVPENTKHSIGIFYTAPVLIRAVEESLVDTDVRPTGHVAAVVFAAAYIEAVVNERLMLYNEDMSPRKKDVQLAQWIRTFRLLDASPRVQLAAIHLWHFKKEISWNADPWWRFRLLTDLRNQLVHMLPEGRPLFSGTAPDGVKEYWVEHDKVVETMRQKKVIDLPRKVREGPRPVSIPEVVMHGKVGFWAQKTALMFEELMEDELGWITFSDDMITWPKPKA